MLDMLAHDVDEWPRAGEVDTPRCIGFNLRKDVDNAQVTLSLPEMRHIAQGDDARLGQWEFGQMIMSVRHQAQSIGADPPLDRCPDNGLRVSRHKGRQPLGGTNRPRHESKTLQASTSNVSARDHNWNAQKPGQWAEIDRGRLKPAIHDIWLEGAKQSHRPPSAKQGANTRRCPRVAKAITVKTKWRHPLLVGKMRLRFIPGDKDGINKLWMGPQKEASELVLTPARVEGANGEQHTWNGISRRLHRAYLSISSRCQSSSMASAQSR